MKKTQNKKRAKTALTKNNLEVVFVDIQDMLDSLEDRDTKIEPYKSIEYLLREARDDIMQILVHHKKDLPEE